MPDFKKVPTVNQTLIALGDHPHPAAGLAMWYDASKLLGLADGAAVASWPDLSGNERDLTQATSGKRPLFKTGILTNQPVVRFDGTDDFLATAAFPAPLAQPSTYLLVVKVATLGVFHTFIDGSGPSNRNYLAAYDTNLWTMYAATALVQGGTVDTGWHLISALFSGAASVLRVDGTQVASGDPGTPPLSGLTMGINGNDLTSGPLNGDLAELVAWNRELSPSELLQAEGELAAKWGLRPVFGRFASLTKWGTD